MKRILSPNDIDPARGRTSEECQPAGSDAGGFERHSVRLVEDFRWCFTASGLVARRAVCRFLPARRPLLTLACMALLAPSGCGKSSPAKPQPVAPVIITIPDLRVQPAGQATIALNAFLAGISGTDSGTIWSWSGNSRISLTLGVGDTLAIAAPSDGWEGTEVITLTATGSSGLSDSQSVRVTVAANRPPVLSDLFPRRIVASYEEGFAPIGLDDLVDDPDDPDSTIVWTVSGASQLGVSISRQRVATVIPPSPIWFGAERVTLTATDPGGFADSARVTLGLGPRMPTGHVYVANCAPSKAAMGNPTSGDIMEIDIATGATVRSLPAGDVPFYLVPSLDKRLLYVVNRGLEYHPDTHLAASRIWTLDLASGAKIGDVSVGGKNPGWMVLHPDGRSAYVAISVKQGKSGVPESVIRLDLTSGEIMSVFPLRGFPLGLCSTSDGSRLFATNTGVVEGPIMVAAPFAVIETETARTTEIDLRNSSYAVSLSPDETVAYVTKPYSMSVEAIDVITGAVLSSTRVKGTTQWITRSPDGERIYVVMRQTNPPMGTANGLVVIDAHSGEVTRTVEVGPGPEGVALTPEGRLIYVTNRNYKHGAVTQGSITVIDAIDLSVIATIPAGEEPLAVCTITDR